MSSSSCTIDVVIRTFNRPVKLRRALESIRQQSPPVSTVIVVDNGDNPATRDAVEEATALASGRHSILYLRSTQGSSRKAAAVGIETSRAGWIILLCDDDYLAPGRIQEDERIIRTVPPDVVLIQHSFLRADYRHRRIWSHHVPTAPVPLASALLFRGMGPPGSCTFRGETARKHHPFREEIGVGDYDLYAALLAHGSGIGSPFFGFVMDDTRVSGRETTMGTQLAEMVLEHERRYAHLASRAGLDQSQFHGVLRREAAFFLGKAKGLKALFSEHGDLARSNLPSLLTGMAAFVRHRFLFWLPLERRGSISSSFSSFRNIDPGLAHLVETNELPG